MRPGESHPGSAAAERAPVMIASEAHLDPRFKSFPNLPEGQYGVDPRRADRGARRTARGGDAERAHYDRAFTDAEIDLLVAIATQVAQSIEHAQLYSQAQHRVHELESLARISEAVSESLYLEESLDAIVKTTMAAVRATGAALVLEDGNIAWPEGARVPTPFACRSAGSAGRSASSSATATRRSPTRSRRCWRRSRVACCGRSGARAGGDARRGRARDYHRGEEQSADGDLALSAWAGSDSVDAHKASKTRSTRISMIAAVHEPGDGAPRGRGRGRRPARAAARDARAGDRRRQGGAPRSSRCSRARARPRSHWCSASCSRTRWSTAARPCG